MVDLPLVSSLKNVHGKPVLVRSDFNVPVKQGRVQDDFKVIKGLETIRRLSAAGAKVIIISHLGRPEGIDTSLSLRPVARFLEKSLRQRVVFFNEKPSANFWPKANQRITGLKPGEIILLENIRFFPEEDKEKGVLAIELAKLADLFVLDGFGVSHRAAASVSGVARLLPHYAGNLLATEVAGLTKVLERPKKPLVVVLGGAKMETKIPVLKKLLPLADQVLVGGGIANTYWWAKGLSVGMSLIDEQFKKEALSYGAKKKIIFPIDAVAGSKDGKRFQIISTTSKFHIPHSNFGIYDIGPKTAELYAEYLTKAQTIVWNGALGFFEQPPYQQGTYSIARHIAECANNKAFAVCGGGETVEVLRDLDIIDDIDLVSTGGGAMLEFLSGKKLPGIEALRKK